MRELNTVQIHEKLNTVAAMDQPGPGGANHFYMIEAGNTSVPIAFQKGPRNEKDSVCGVIDSDLLEIVRDRLRAFQKGPFASKYNEEALIHVESALLALNERVEDRIKRNVLGKNEK